MFRVLEIVDWVVDSGEVDDLMFIEELRMKFFFWCGIMVCVDEILIIIGF